MLLSYLTNKRRLVILLYFIIVFQLLFLIFLCLVNHFPAVFPNTT